MRWVTLEIRPLVGVAVAANAAGAAATNEGVPAAPPIEEVVAGVATQEIVVVPAEQGVLICMDRQVAFGLAAKSVPGVQVERNSGD